MARSHPKVSIVIPLIRHHGHAPDAIASWTRQSYPRERIERVVLSDGSDQALERTVQGVLGLGERLIRHPSGDERELFDVGARAAQGELLILTESHCVAEPDFLEEMTRFVDQGAYAGACCRTVGVYTNAIGRAVCRDFETNFQTWSRPEDRRKVIIHGFAIRREVYLAVGGFEPPFGNFQDAALAAKLDLLGHRLGYAARARVRHHYSPRLRDTVDQFRSYVEGECAYGLAHSEGFCDEQFGVAPEWHDWARDHPADYRRILAVLARHLLRRGVWRFNVPLVRRVGRALWERYGSRDLAATWSWRVAWLRCQLWRSHPARMHRAFRDLCARIVHQGRLRFLDEHAAELRRRRKPDGRGRCPAGCAEGHWPMAWIPQSSLVGFHTLESHGGGRFRWSRPIASLRLTVPPGPYQVALDTRGLRPLRRAGVRIFFAGRLVPRRRISLTRAGVVVPVEPDRSTSDADQWLILTCNPLSAKADLRPLGLPIFSVTVTRRADLPGPPAQPAPWSPPASASPATRRWPGP